MKKLLQYMSMSLFVVSLFVSGFFFVMPGSYAVAQTQGDNLSYTPLEPLLGIDSNPREAITLPTLLNGLFKLLITLGALFAVGTFVYGGITYMVSDIVHQKETARERMVAALWGLVLVIASVLILNTINPQLSVFNFSAPTSDGQAGRNGN